jgi:hypothetical protein
MGKVVDEFLGAIDKERKELKNNKDFFEKHKAIGNSRVYMIGGKERGAVIFIYIKGKDDLESLFEEVHFMDWKNAVAEYNDLKKQSDLLDIIQRNN